MRTNRISNLLASADQKVTSSPGSLAAFALMPALMLGSAAARSPLTQGSVSTNRVEQREDGFVVNSVLEKPPPVPVPPLAPVDPKFSVLIDRSHAWAFAFDDLSERILKPSGFDVIMSDAALDTTVKMRQFGVVACIQWEKTGAAVAYSDHDIEKLKKHVEAGGSLLIAGAPDSPVAKVAKEFGVRMDYEEVTGRALVAPWLQKAGAPGEVVINPNRPLRCVVKPPNDAEKAIVDEKGRTVACRFSWGAGKVLCFADDASYWDFCAQRDPAMNVPNMPLTVAMFMSLLPEGAQRASAGAGQVPQRPRGELWTSIGSIVIFYSEPVRPHASKLISKIPGVLSIVKDSTRTHFAGNTMVVNMLACGGGGYSGGPEVGIQTTGDQGNNIAVLAHELTHSYTGPLPHIFGEGYASLVGMRAAKLLGYRKVAETEREGWRNLALSQDPKGSSLDINRAETEPAMIGPCEGKVMDMIEELERKYGADFMPRFLEATRAIKGNKSPTVQECLLYMSYAAGKDLGGWYRSLGIRYEPSSLLTRAEFETKIKAYRAAAPAPR